MQRLIGQNFIDIQKTVFELYESSKYDSRGLVSHLQSGQPMAKSHAIFLTSMEFLEATVLAELAGQVKTIIDEKYWTAPTDETGHCFICNRLTDHKHPRSGFHVNSCTAYIEQSKRRDTLTRLKELFEISE